MEMCYNHMFIYAEFEIIIMFFFKERRLKYKPAYILNTQNVLHFLCLYRGFSLVMEICFKVMEKSWKSHGNPLVKMCKNPGYVQVLGEEGYPKRPRWSGASEPGKC